MVKLEISLRNAGSPIKISVKIAIKFNRLHLIFHILQ